MFPSIRPRAWLIPAVAFLAVACGNNSYGMTSNNPPNPTVADIKIVSGARTKTNQAFNPNPYTVALNGAASVTVKWGNDDGTVHRVTEDGASPTFASNNMAGGTTFSHDFTTAGTYTYHCSIHPTMVGTVVVTP